MKINLNGSCYLQLIWSGIGLSIWFIRVGELFILLSVLILMVGYDNFILDVYMSADLVATTRFILKSQL